MKIVQINTFPNGSTGNIMMEIHRALLENSHDSYVVWGRGRKPKDNHEICINNKFDIYFHALYSRLTGKTGFASKISTKRLLKKLDLIKPDIIHLHNIHGYYINIELLFNYLYKNNIKVIWTLHDCWAFTGQCPHFTLINCNKWETHCEKCPQLNTYPKSLVDSSFSNYNFKKELFSNIRNLTIVTPSVWLSNLVKKSFLKDKNVIVINNGVDTGIFKPLKKNQLHFRKKYNLQNKKIILGVASPWTIRKGLDDFIQLSQIINDDYKIVLVGLSKKQIKKLPSNILGIEKTTNIYELVDIYNSSDIFFNPTYEDNYPTVNLEALSCGTPVITYNTGGSPECINLTNGKVVTKNEILKNYEKIFNKKYQLSNNCNYSKEKAIKKYIEIYKNA